MLAMRFPAAALLAFLLAGGRCPAGEPAPALRDKPPVVVEVLAACSGGDAEEVERQITIPLEVTLAGMPRLQTLRSKSAAGLSRLQAGFKPGTDYDAARREVINRLQVVQPLPPGISPSIVPWPGGERLHYILVGPRDAAGRPVYTTNDLRTLQKWHLEGEFRRLPGVVDVASRGGTIKRYEIQPDPDRLRRYGITLRQLMDAVAGSNANVAAGHLVQGQVAVNVRAVGLFGGGVDPLSAEALTAADPVKAAKLLRAAEQQRLREIRGLVVGSVNNQPVSVADLVEGGRTPPGEVEGSKGVVVGSRPRLGKIACSGPGNYEAADVVEGVVYLRRDEEPRALGGVQDRIRELNATAGRLLPGVRIEPYCVDNGSGTGALWVYGIAPLNTSAERMAELAHSVATKLREFPEVERIVSRIGASAEADLQASNHLQFFVGLKASSEVPAAPGRDSPRSRTELIEAFIPLLEFKIPGVGWMTTTRSPEELGLIFPGAPAEHLLKIVGPDLNELERLAGLAQAILKTVPGIESVAAYHSLGLTNLVFRIDPGKCQRWGLQTADVNNVVATALRGKTMTQMIEGEKSFDITVQWPQRLCNSETAILDLPVDVGSTDKTENAPRLRLRDLVAPLGKDGQPDPQGQFERLGAAAIYREQGTRLLPVRFSVRGRSLADARAEAAKRIAPLLKAPYRIEWSD